MASISRILADLARHVDYTQRYFLEWYENKKLEAKHGFSEDPSWWMSPESLRALTTHGEFLKLALSKITRIAQSQTSRPQFLAYVRQQCRRLAREIKQENPGLPSPTHAELEVLTTLKALMTRTVYIPRNYHKWNATGLNRWYHTPYVPENRR